MLLNRWNKLGIKWATKIAKDLEMNDHTVQILYHPYTTIEVESVKIIAKALEMNHTVQSLNFYHCDLGPDGATILAKALERRDIGLQELNLFNNDIGDEGIKAFANTIMEERTKNQTRTVVRTMDLP